MTRFTASLLATLAACSAGPDPGDRVLEIPDGSMIVLHADLPMIGPNCGFTMGQAWRYVRLAAIEPSPDRPDLQDLFYIPDLGTYVASWSIADAFRVERVQLLEGLVFIYSSERRGLDGTDVECFSHWTGTVEVLP